MSGATGGKFYRLPPEKENTGTQLKTPFESLKRQKGGKKGREIPPLSKHNKT